MSTGFPPGLRAWRYRYESEVVTRDFVRFLKRQPQSRVVLQTCAEAFSVADAVLDSGHEVRVAGWLGAARMFGSRHRAQRAALAPHSAWGWPCRDCGLQAGPAPSALTRKMPLLHARLRECQLPWRLRSRRCRVQSPGPGRCAHRPHCGGRMLSGLAGHGYGGVHRVLSSRVHLPRWRDLHRAREGLFDGRRQRLATRELR